MVASSLSEKIYLHLKNSINSLELSPGTPLREADLANTFQSSRTPVREALRRLEAEGLIDFASGRGATVADVSVRDVLDAYEIRELLEPFATSRVAHNKANHEAIRDLLGRLETLSDNPHTPTELADRETFDKDLHLLIADLAENEQMAKIIHDMRTQVWRVFRIIGNRGQVRFRSGKEEHRAILMAILDGDGDLAADLMHNHLKESRLQLLNPTINPIDSRER